MLNKILTYNEDKTELIFIYTINHQFERVVT